jgi:long-chain acyl-CoA synthetase
VSPGGAIDYGEFARMVAAAAARLRNAGQGRGDRVLLCGPNSPELAAAYFAVHAVGGVATLADADIPAPAARWVVADSGARLALGLRDLELPVPQEDLREFCRPGGAARPADPLCGLQDPADLLYTTGTSGRKKGVLLTQGQIAQAAVNINAFLTPRPDDVELLPIPLSHSFGLGRLRAMARAGHALALEPGMRNAAQTLGRLLDLKAGGLALVPAGIELILRMTKERLADARQHLRYVEIGSAPMCLQTKRKLMELLPATRLCHHYGLTEASRAAFLEYHADCEKLESIGRPAPNVQMAVHDERGRALPAGQQGELVVRGGMVMQEYWQQPELTRRALRDGWLYTGDWGARDAEGYFYLLGRQTDLVNVGGVKVSPEEVERLLDAHPAVVESACLGVPDPRQITGQCLKACLVTRRPVADAELVHWLRQRLEESKIPRVWQRVERIARTDSGKIQRHLM